MKKSEVIKLIKAQNPQYITQLRDLKHLTMLQTVLKVEEHELLDSKARKSR